MAAGRGLGETARLIASLDLQDNFSRGIGTALGSLGRFESGLGRMGRGIGQVGSGLDRLATRGAVAAAGGLAAVVTAAGSFEQAFTGIEKTVDETANTTLPELEEALRRMARTIPVSFEELAGIGEAGGALGIAADDLESFVDVVARLAVSTNLSSDQAANALGQLGNVLHLSGGDFRDFADSLVALGNAGASTESQIVEIAARFGAAGNAAGLSKEEILALSSAVASMGIDVEAGGSALSRIFNSVATNIGTSSDKAVAFADTLGLSAKEFRRAWEEDALGTFQDFLTELSKLDQFEQASVLKSIGITNTRDVNTVRLMGQNVGFVADQLRIAQDAQGALNTESQKFFDTASGQFQTLKNNLRDAGVTIGNELLPLFKELVQEFTEFLNRPGTRESLRNFGQDLAAGIRRVVDEIRKIDFGRVVEQFKSAAGFAKTAFDVFNALPGPVKSALIAGVAINKVTGGALGQISAGLGNIAGGLFGRGGIFQRGSPTNPMFVSVVGGGLGGPGGVVGGAGGLGGLLLRALGLGGAAFAGFELGNFIGHQAFFDPTVKPTQERENRQFADFVNRNAGDQAKLAHGLDVIDDSLADLYGVNADARGIMLILAGDQVRQLEAQREQLRLMVRATPTGQFVPQNPGGVPGTPAGRDTNGLPAFLFDHLGAVIKTENQRIRSALREGDIHTARNLQRVVDSQNALRGVVSKRVNDIIPHLGRTNRALSFANRKLDEGNARQQRLAAGIREARDATRTGFQASNRWLGTSNSTLRGIDAKEAATAGNTARVAAKDFSTSVSVTVPVSTTVSVDNVIRAVVSHSVATGAGFGPNTP